MDRILLFQFSSGDISLVISGISVLISLGVFTVYILRYRQQERQLAKQRRQLENQEEQLETQWKQLDNQEEELRQYERELAELERQNELTEIQHQAHIEVEEYEFENDRIVVLLSNYGNGPATNLHLETELETDAENLQLHPGESRLRRRDGDSNHPYEGQAVHPGEQRIEFEGEAIVGVEDPTGDIHQRSIRGVLMDLRQEADGEAVSPNVSFRILATTLTQEEHVVEVTERPLSLSVPAGSEQFCLATIADRMGQL